MSYQNDPQLQASIAKMKKTLTAKVHPDMVELVQVFMESSYINGEIAAMERAKALREEYGE